MKIKIKKAWRRWLFRRMFKNYQTFQQSQPKDNEFVVILDAENATPVWVARYDSANQSFSAGGGWFEKHEIDYWAPTLEVD